MFKKPKQIQDIRTYYNYTLPLKDRSNIISLHAIGISFQSSIRVVIQPPRKLFKIHFPFKHATEYRENDKGIQTANKRFRKKKACLCAVQTSSRNHTQGRVNRAKLD